MHAASRRQRGQERLARLVRRSLASMNRPRAVRFQARLWTLLALIISLPGSPAPAQQPFGGKDPTPGQFFTIAEPITHETIARIQAATRQLVDRHASAAEGARPILVFEFLPGDTAPGASGFGACYDLASLISKDLAGAKLTVAYVPHPLTGYAVLPA